MIESSARLTVLAALVLLVGCDHATKGVAKAELDSGGTRELIRGVVDLRYVENTDIAFNLLRWVPEVIRKPGLLVLGGVAISVLALWLLHARKEPWLRRFALVLVFAGAVGNYLDRVVRGYVVDFVHVHHWPVFNVADVYISVGYALLALGFIVYRRAEGVPRRESG
jgi:signal peptidase II